MGEAGDPFRRVQSLGSQARWRAAIIGLVTVGAHVVAALGAFATAANASTVAPQEIEIAIDVADAPPPPVATPPAPEPEVNAPKPDVVRDAPPKPSLASKIITANDAPDARPAKWDAASGDGAALGGAQSATGDGDRVVHDEQASSTGVVAAPAAPRPPPAPPLVPPPAAPDLSKPPTLAGSKSWSCPFPAEADADQIDHATVQIQVTVGGDGSATAVKVLDDPGHGFARAARRCALARRFTPAIDRNGASIAGMTPPITVRFKR